MPDYPVRERGDVYMHHGMNGVLYNHRGIAYSVENFLLFVLAVFFILCAGDIMYGVIIRKRHSQEGYYG